MKKSILFYLVLLFSFSIYARKEKKDVFASEYIRDIMLKTVRWQFSNPYHGARDWTNAAFYAGAFAAWEVTGENEIYDKLMSIGQNLRWRPARRWYHADDIAVCQNYIDLYRTVGKREMIQPTIDTLALFISRPYPSKKKAVEIIKLWWCDALFMAPPVFVKLGITLNNPIYLEFSDIYFKEAYDLLYDNNEKLFFRDLNYVIRNDRRNLLEANGKPIYWSRGNGWVMGGLVRILQELPADYKMRSFYESLFKEMASRVIELQQKDGLWRASLLDPDSYPGGEVSGSGFFCYALAWGINNGLLDEELYRPFVEKTWKALNQCVSPEGRVGWVQPIGADPRKNFSEDSWEVYGTGAFLLAGSEIIKMK